MFLLKFDMLWRNVLSKFGANVFFSNFGGVNLLNFSECKCDQHLEKPKCVRFTCRCWFHFYYSDIFSKYHHYPGLLYVCIYIVVSIQGVPFIYIYLDIIDSLPEKH